VPSALRGSESIEGIEVERARLEGEPMQQRPIMIGEKLDISCQLLVTSIGYKSLPIEGLPFDGRRCVVPNDHGYVEPGVYTAGWLKRGPVGIIDSTLRDSVATYRIIKHHIEQGEVESKDTSLEEVLAAIEGTRPVNFDDWLKVDRAEKEVGKLKGKPREKLKSKEEILGLMKATS